tara:strand:+ start:622 stop:1074 length:453 start_codon:yes stop_codon:yes gene_type:complete
MRTRIVKGLSLLSLSFLGCGDPVPTGPDPLIEPFVGDWAATAFVLTSSVSDQVSIDLIQLGGTFDLNIQPSGSYTAILVYAGLGQTEIGTISVTATTVALNREFPTRENEISTYQFVGDSVLILDGDTEFDLDFDGQADPTLAHFELLRK